MNIGEKSGTPGIYDRIARGAALLTAILGFVVLASWTTGYLQIARVSSSFIPTAPATALLFFLFGISLLFASRAGRMLAGVVLAAAAVLLCEAAANHLFGTAYDLEEIFLPAPDAFGNVRIGRISPLAALIFVLFALTASSSGRPGRSPGGRASLAHLPAFAAAILTAAILVGYLYSAPLLYGGDFIPVALPTAIGFFLLGVAIILGAPQGPFRRWLASSSISAHLTRRILPPIVAVIFMHGWWESKVDLSDYSPVWRVVNSSSMAFLVSAIIIGITAVVTRAADLRLRHAEMLRLRERRRLEFFVAIGDKLFQMPERELVQEILEFAVKSTESAIGYFHFMNEETGNVELFTWTGEAMQECRAKNPEVYALAEAGVWADSVRTRSPAMHNDFMNLPTRKCLPDGHVPVTRHLSVPVFDGDKIRMILGLGNKKTDYDDDDADFMKAVGQGVWPLVEKLRADTERRRFIAELEAKNAELERFTYTVSHDLKSPLFTIGGYIGFIEKAVKEGRSDEALRDLLRIQSAAEKMTRLLEDILEYSRVGRVVGNFRPVDFGAVVDEALELLAGKINERKVRIERDAAFAHVMGDRRRLVEVVQNLVENAVKFTEQVENPVIHIGQVVRDGVPAFYVRDNGLGINPKYHGKIFGIFEKLSAKSSGTGIGLALVKRIVECHNGRIWVESAGEGAGGSAFFFTLSAAGPGMAESAIAPARERRMSHDD